MWLLLNCCISGISEYKIEFFSNLSYGWGDMGSGSHLAVIQKVKYLLYSYFCDNLRL